jgi:DNA-binding protein HU-beta
MNKGEFIKAIAEKTELTGKQADAAYKAFVETVVEQLREGNKVQLVGFGTFELQFRKAREAFNPLTKSKIQVKASYAPKLKIGKSFKSLFNENK